MKIAAVLAKSMFCERCAGLPGFGVFLLQALYYRTSHVFKQIVKFHGPLLAMHKHCIFLCILYMYIPHVFLYIKEMKLVWK